MTPFEYYRQLVRDANVEPYLRTRLPEPAVTNLLGRMGINLDRADTVQLITKAASEGRQPILDALVEDIFNGISEEDRGKLAGRIFAGEFPTGKFNASARRVPNGNGYVFLLNVGLMSLIYDVAKILLTQSRWARFDEAGKPEPGTETGGRELSKEEAGTFLRDMLQHYGEFREWAPPKSGFVIEDETRNMILAGLVLAAERFVLAHEFGHALLGHLDKNKNFSLTVPHLGINLSLVSKSQKDEFMADLKGGALILGTLPKEINDRLTAFNVEITVAGPFLCFEIIKLIEKVLNHKSSTHPPADKRSQLLEAAFRESLPEQAFGFNKGLRTLFRSLEKYV